MDSLQAAGDSTALPSVTPTWVASDQWNKPPHVSCVKTLPLDDTCVYSYSYSYILTGLSENLISSQIQWLIISFPISIHILGCPAASPGEKRLSDKGAFGVPRMQHPVFDR